MSGEKRPLPLMAPSTGTFADAATAWFSPMLFFAAGVVIEKPSLTTLTTMSVLSAESPLVP